MFVEAVTLILPFQNRAAELPGVVLGWRTFFTSIDRPYEILLVNCNSTDTSAAVATELAKDQVKFLAEPANGFGTALRNGIAAAQHPLIAYCGLDYPYNPNDMAKLLDRIDDVDQAMNRKIDLVSGCRNGLPGTVFWALIGYVYRLLARVLFGLPLQAPLGWLGTREHFRSWVAWLLLGDPLTDPNSAFKLIRKSVLDKFPIQSDGDFVHVEIVGKATFTTCLMDELPLNPVPVAIPYADWKDFWKVFNDPKFHAPAQASDTPLSPEAA